MTFIKKRVLALLVSMLIGVTQLKADVRLPRIFSSNMVLQQGRGNPIWGWADKGEIVSIEIAGKHIQTKGGPDGTWKANLPAMDYGGPYILKVQGSNTIELKNILIGEVWVCSGQSNMGVPVQSANDSTTEIANANYPSIRLFVVASKLAQFPLQDLEQQGHWVECSPATVKRFTAVGYFFGRDLHKRLNVPVGLISSCVGGTSAEIWTSGQTIQNDPDFKEPLQKLLSLDSVPGMKKNDYPTILFNAMINPLIPFGIKGVIWYQGENNAGRAAQYHRIFPNLIKDWRTHWKQGDFPFLFVSLANYRPAPERPAESSWAALREAQASVLSWPNTGMALAIDLGDADDLHPKGKQGVGYRLALSALNVAYKKNVIASGPVYKSIKLDGNVAYIRFSDFGSPLLLKYATYKIPAFAIAGPDKKFYWAEARLVGKNTIRLQSSEVSQPVAVRYAWADNPGDLNLYNKEGLPAAPFRTDKW